MRTGDKREAQNDYSEAAAGGKAAGQQRDGAVPGRQTVFHDSRVDYNGSQEDCDSAPFPSGIARVPSSALPDLSQLSL